MNAARSRSQPGAVDTAGAVPIDASVAVLGGYPIGASSSSFIFVPAFDYVPSFYGSNRRSKEIPHETKPGA